MSQEPYKEHDVFGPLIVPLGSLEEGKENHRKPVLMLMRALQSAYGITKEGH